MRRGASLTEGLLAAWDGTNKDHDNTVQEVAKVFDGCPSALKMTHTYDASHTGGAITTRRSNRNQGYKLGGTGFCGFVFRLSEEWQTSPAQPYNIAQSIANLSEHTDCDDWMPSN